MYKFVKIIDKRLPNLNYSYMLFCDTNQTLIDHNNKYNNNTLGFYWKEKCIQNHGHVLLRENGSFMYLSSDHEIISEIKKTDLIYPN